MQGRPQERQRSDSFLVRCWMEPREVEDQPGVVRIYVRNLRSGEEHYLTEASQLGELVERGLVPGEGEGVEAGDRRTLEVG